MGVVTHSGQPLTVWEMAEVARTVEGKALLHRLLAEITEGAAFKGSHRSAQFLEYVVQQSASGNREAKRAIDWSRTFWSPAIL